MTFPSKTFTMCIGRIFSKCYEVFSIGCMILTACFHLITDWYLSLFVLEIFSVCEEVSSSFSPVKCLNQVAERQGKHLVELFNKIGTKNGGKALSMKDIPLGEPFVYKHLGSMASVGRYKALVDLRQSKVLIIVRASLS